MKMHLYKLSGYEETINAVRMSTGKYWSWQKAQEIQDLVYVVTDRTGAIASYHEYLSKLPFIGASGVPSKHPKVTGNYETDVAEFKRLLEITMNQAMKEQKHHTLMKYIDISFFSEGLHRGAQDDLDAHAIGFNNRITRFSTRLAEIDEVKLSEWYQDKVIPFHDAIEYLSSGKFGDMANMPQQLLTEKGTFTYTPFGYVLNKYADESIKSGRRKDVVRGLMNIGMASNALWKTDLFNLRYIYHMRSKLTKANPELKDAMEMLADQIEQALPVFGGHFRHVYTDTEEWEHTNKTRTCTRDEYDLLCKIKEGKVRVSDAREESK